MTVLDKHLGEDRLRLVDIGARGGVASRWDRFASVLDVTAFEPDPAECERLNREAACLPYPAHFLPYAIGRQSGDNVPFHVANWPVASSLYRPNAEFLRSFPQAARLLEVGAVQSISVSSLDDVARRENLPIDCLKVDVEGAALDVLVGGETALDGSLALEVEAEMNPLFEGEALFADVDAHLRNRGWALQGLRRTSWRRGAPFEPSASGLGGQIISVDALYCNGGFTGQLPLARELKLLVILSAYLQADAVLARLRSSEPIAAGLNTNELDELVRLLVPRPGPIRRFARRVSAGRARPAGARSPIVSSGATRPSGRIRTSSDIAHRGHLRASVDSRVE
ncbi:MAG TPA: FkbM family methyltransferase [Solirubrobacterales bacterium]|nr:FkbM family methyltransferase [Solirubrobacterales bacterium]